MLTDRDAATFFDGFAETFDDSKRGALMRWVDRRYRGDMFLRLSMTFQAFGDAPSRILSIRR